MPVTKGTINSRLEPGEDKYPKFGQIENVDCSTELHAQLLTLISKVCEAARSSQKKEFAVLEAVGGAGASR